MITFLNRDSIVTMSSKGSIGFLNMETGSLDVLQEWRQNFSSVVMIQPLGDFIATINVDSILDILNVITGSKVNDPD